MKKSALFLLITLLTTGVVTSAVYKWVDEEGKVHYGDSPASVRGAEQIEIEQGPSEKEVQQTRERTERLIADQKRKEEPQEVFGTVVIGFAPTVLAMMPEPPFILALKIRSVDGGRTIEHRITDPAPDWMVEKGNKPEAASIHQNFRLSLRPGSYEISEVVMQSDSLSNEPLSFALKVAIFNVPEGNCVYVGRFGHTYIRLPSGSYEQTQAVARSMAIERGKGNPVVTLYLVKGSLIPDSYFVDQPTETEQMHDYKVLSEASSKQCVTNLVEFK